MAHTGSIKSASIPRPKKRLGQHYLVNPAVIDEIVARSGFQSSDLVLEIGPGMGALTLPLAPLVGHIIAVEKDGELVNVLGEKLTRAGVTNVTIINRDILEWDLNEINPFGLSRIQVAGNLPYNISSFVLEKLIDNRAKLGRAVLMFQSEFAKRLTASPGNKAYGAMTLLVRYHTSARMLFEVTRESFHPVPKVDSMLVELDFGQPYPRRSTHEADFEKVVKGAFSHRRKMLLNSLTNFSPAWSRKRLLQALRECGIDPGRRAESLDMDDFLCLSTALH